MAKRPTKKQIADFAGKRFQASIEEHHAMLVAKYASDPRLRWHIAEALARVDELEEENSAQRRRIAELKEEIIYMTENRNG